MTVQAGQVDRELAERADPLLRLLTFAIVRRDPAMSRRLRIAALDGLATLVEPA
jgi:hypothetical protein